MKYTLSILVFTSVLISVIFARPEGYSPFESNEEFEKDGPVIVLSEISDPLDAGFGTGFFGTVRENPFNGFLSSMQNMMNRLRQQIAQHLPNSYPGQGTFFGLTNIPEGANTTSTTKVINGHVVTVNETTYSDGDDVQGTIVRVRIVDIKPENGDNTDNPVTDDVTATPDAEEISTSSGTDRSVESVENTADNEIPERLVEITPV